jgi:tetratricopeptide (TPR) repeat protein
MVDVAHLLPEPVAQGTLAKTPFPHLLIYAHDRQLSGTFEFAGPGDDGGTVLVIDGQPTKVRTIRQTTYLGRVLLELGLITDEQLDVSLRALAIQKRLHGQILLETGVLTEEQLQLGLRAQLVRKMQALVRLPAETTFKYYDGFDALASYGGDGHEGIDPYPLVWAAIREEPPWEHVRGALANIGTAGFRLAEEAETARFSFDKGERTTIELLRSRPQRLQELTSAGKLPARLVQLLVYCLMVTKQVELVSDSLLPLPAQLEPPSFPLSSRPAALAEESPPSSSRSRPATDPPPSPNQVARVQLTQREIAMSRAVVESKREDLPPDDRRAPSPEPPAVAAVSPPPPRPTAPAAHVAAPHASSGPPGDALSPELAARRKDILERAAKIDDEDYFMMLGVDRDAQPQAVQAAFFAFAKTWHPDRVPAAIGDVKEQCARVFSRLSEAHQTLSDAQKRSRYVTLLDQGAGGDEAQAEILRVVEASTNFQKAEICLKRNDFAQAEEYCKKAISGDAKQADYHSLLAWLLAMKPQGQTAAATEARIDDLTRAIKMNKMCERAYFYRGMLYKRLRRDDKAVRDFRRAFELNPRNIDAQREVRIFEMRRGSIPSPGAAKKTGKDEKKTGKEDEKNGLFGRLFKK